MLMMTDVIHILLKQKLMFIKLKEKDINNVLASR